MQWVGTGENSSHSVATYEMNDLSVQWDHTGFRIVGSYNTLHETIQFTVPNSVQLMKHIVHSPIQYIQDILQWLICIWNLSKPNYNDSEDTEYCVLKNQAKFRMKPLIAGAQQVAFIILTTTHHLWELSSWICKGVLKSITQCEAGMNQCINEYGISCQCAI